MDAIELACHTIGHGDKIGPDLLGVTRTRDHDWLVRMIQKPEQLLNGQDPIGTVLLKKYNNVRMPNLSVSDEERDYLIGYMEAQTAAHDKAKELPSSNAGQVKAGTPVNAAGPPNWSTK